jgi:hypothetical protein
MKGFKGFDKDMKCLGLQYEVGKTATHTGDVVLCSRGLHFCQHPLDTWSYYKPLDGSRYAEVEAEGVQDKTSGDSKRAAQSLTVKAEIKIPALLYAHSATTGYSAHSATTGYSAESSAIGKQAIAVSLGAQGKAKAARGNWIVLVEWEDGKIKNLGHARVDGKTIKADTFYMLKDGKFTEVAK